nr:MAG TPA: hypothetical protein [Bacteriophage sp.]
MSTKRFKLLLTHKIILLLICHAWRANHYVLKS